MRAGSTRKTVIGNGRQRRERKDRKIEERNRKALRFRAKPRGCRVQEETPAEREALGL